MEFVGYLGTMNSMKSAMALMKARKYLTDGESHLAFKPGRDSRDGAFIASRAIKDKLEANVVEFHERDVMYNMCRFVKPDHVIVDEVQFMPEHQIEELARIAYELDIKVECFGLKVDFMTHLFPGSRRLIELADRIVNVENDCSVSGCRNPATKNIRLEDGKPIFHGQIIQVGKEETYRSVCLSCYMRMKKEAESNGTEI